MSGAEKTASATRRGRPRAIRDGLFVVMCAADTGSSMLISLLKSHPDVLCHAGVFNPERVEGLSGTYMARLTTESGLEQRVRDLRKHDPAAFLYKLVFDTQGRTHAGFRIMYEELILPMFAGARTALLADIDIKIIHLRRRNLLRRYLSSLPAKPALVAAELKAGAPPRIGGVRIDPFACQADFERTLRSDTLIQRMFQKHQILDIDYEDLTGAQEERFQAELLDFLGLAPHPLQATISKAANDDLASLISNLTEVRAHFQNTPFINFFQVG